MNAIISEISWNDILTQGLGIFALICFMVSFQIKDTRKTQLFFIPGNIAYGIHYILLGSLAGGIILLSSAVRDAAGVYASNRLLKLFIFFHLTVAVFSLIFFGKSWLELLVLLSSVLSSLAALYRDHFERFRLLIVGRQIAMLSFNLWIGSIGGIIHLTIVLISNVIGLKRYSRKDKDIILEK